MRVAATCFRCRIQHTDGGALAMNDMDALVAEYRALMRPQGPDREALYERKAHTRRYADDSHVLFPGHWALGGHHRGRLEVDKMWEAVRILWPEGTRLLRSHFFVGEDTIAIEWWSRNAVWNGAQAQNSGVGRLRFRDGEVIDHHEITDTEYFDEIHGDWRSAMGPELGRYLPSFTPAHPPFYPDPAKNDWALDDSPTDGRNCAPQDLRAHLTRVQDWMEDPAQRDSEIFSDDVLIFFQGRLWPLGGEHRGRRSLQTLAAVAQRVWPNGQRVVRANYWAAEDRVLVEWFVEYQTWRGQACREGGFSVWHFEGERVTSVHTYVDTSFHTEVLGGWQDVVGAELGGGLPCWVIPPVPRYPRPSEHR